MKKVSLMKLYVLLFVSSGLYGFIWLYQLLETLKEKYSYQDKRIIQSETPIILLAVFFLVIGLGVYFSDGRNLNIGRWGGVLEFSLFLVAGTILFCFLYNLILVNSYLKRSLGLKTPNNFVVVIFYFLFFLSPIKIQSTINSYIEWDEAI